MDGQSIEPGRGDRRGQEREPLRTFRADADLWAAVKLTAKVRRESVSHVIRRSLRNYVRRHADEVAEAVRANTVERRSGVDRRASPREGPDRRADPDG